LIFIKEILASKVIYSVQTTSSTKNTSYHITSILHPPSYNDNYNQIKMPINTSSQDTGVTGAAKFVTSTLGNTVGGVARTVGGVTGAATRGVGDTITSATGSAGKPVGDAIGSAGTGVEDGAKRVAGGVEDAGQWR
jgi:hypothetical protein